MGLLNWWNDNESQAERFLKTGTYNDLVRNRPSYSSNNNNGSSNGCTSSSQCGANFACVGGQCVRMDAGGNNGQVNYPGQCDSDDPTAPCNAGGPNSCQQTPTPCGSDTSRDDARDCCGTRCCSFGSASSTRPGIHCYCGECPPWPTCSSFCEAYLKANGEKGPGCSEGRDGNSCDSCTHCASGQCVPNLSNFTPCWCDDGNECSTKDCQRCQTDPEKEDYGECYFEEEGCQKCASIVNHLCPCGKVLSPITVCQPYNGGGLLPINQAQQQAAEQCAELCKNDDECPPVECHCHDDCGDDDCSICDEEGTCQPNPACEDLWVAKIPIYREIRDEYCSGEDVCTGGDVIGPWKRALSTTTKVADEIDVRWELVSEGTINKFYGGCSASCDIITVQDGTPYGLYSVSRDGELDEQGYRTIVQTCYIGPGFGNRDCWSIRGDFVVAVGYGETSTEAIADAEENFPL